MSQLATQPEPTADEIQNVTAKYLKEGGISAITPEQLADCASKCHASIAQGQTAGRSK